MDVLERGVFPHTLPDLVEDNNRFVNFDTAAVGIALSGGGVGMLINTFRAQKRTENARNTAYLRLMDLYPPGDTLESVNAAIDKLQQEYDARASDLKNEKKKISLSAKHNDEIARYKAEMDQAQNILNNYRDLATKLQSAQDAIDKKFNAAVKAGDDAFDKEDYDTAMSKYNAALKIKADDDVKKKLQDAMDKKQAALLVAQTPLAPAVMPAGPNPAATYLANAGMPATVGGISTTKIILFGVIGIVGLGVLAYMTRPKKTA